MASLGMALSVTGVAVAKHDHTKAKILKGPPKQLDFGHGLIIPLGQGAFHTLWEGDDRWMAFGLGVAQNQPAAMGLAEDAAEATMKLYLITLALKPERMVRVEKSGWRLKSGRSEDLVRGTIDLPGRPVQPSVDTSNDAADMDPEGSPFGATDRDLKATTYWRIWKSDVDLDFVRNHAVLPM